MSENIDVQAILLRAEHRAKDRLELHRPATASTSYQERLAELEEAHATACAVRRYWEECEQRASAPNRSAESVSEPHNDECVHGVHLSEDCPACAARPEES